MTTTTTLDTPIYNEADVAEIVRAHCRVNGTYNYEWLPTLTYRQGVWRVTWDYVYWSGSGTVTFTEATAQLTVIEGCSNAR